MKPTSKKKAQKAPLASPKGKKLDTLSLYDLELVNGGMKEPTGGTKDMS
jgi:hypothetical protein